MPNRVLDGRAVCPYWRGCDSTAVHCEGPCAGSAVTIRFRDRELMEKYAEERCCTFEYAGRCPLAEALEEKWREK